MEGLIAAMTIEEKISLLAGVDLWHTAEIQRLGVPSIKVTDGPNGARGAWGDMGPSSALFPIGSALSATWDTLLIEEVGAALAAEVKAKGAHMLLAPTVNIHRTPLAGRNFECYSEDPYLSGKIAAAYVRGMQGEGISACIKHFVCNDQEFERTSISAEVDERTLREIYLEPFRIALAEARPWSIMSSYNRLNGVYANENAMLLKGILKHEWQFDGLVVSDWNGTYSEAASQGGLDLEMPGPARWMGSGHVRRALESGALTQAELDDKIRRLLRLMERVGAFEHRERREERAENTPEQRAFMRRLAGETIVLLKNETTLLPLKPGAVRKIAVIGELAHEPNAMGGGSSRVRPHYLVSPLQGIQRRAEGLLDVTYAAGCAVHKRAPAFERDSVTDETGEAHGFNLRLYDNLDFSGQPTFEMITDHTSFDLWGPTAPNVNQSRFCASLSGIFTAREGGTHTFGLTSVGKSRMWLDDTLLIDNWENPVQNHELQARKNLSAGQQMRLRVEYLWNGDDYWRYLRLGHRPPSMEDPIAEAVLLAKQADVAIVVAGLTNEWESEGYDRASMSLPGRQDELIAKVVRANPNTIVVLNTGSPVAMPWADDVPAIIQGWYNSQECGNALADVLFGDVNPSGRLPTTFPRRYEDNPTIDTYPGKGGKVFYREGLLVGYRHYDARGIEPLFPFGHGLSYTGFEYSDLKLSRSQISADETVEVSLVVRNVGQRAGKEVIQLYVHDLQSTLARPEQELKAFAKVGLEPGEAQTVRFSLGREAFWYFDPDQAGWIVEPGEFEVRVGHSSRDIRLRLGLLVSAATNSGHQRADAIPSRTS
ncbi:MAG TPA: glycoside hydrolase family 3 C-terminal domain-containing protein [Anaerolineales bacterium]